MKIKDLYRRFRSWQLRPPHNYKRDSDKHVCANCGCEFEGTYCPTCGQKNTVGAANWKSVGYDLMKAFGKESESLISSILQLLGRPGYLISDYINGRRKICYSPVNMLFVLAVVTLLVIKLLGEDFSQEDVQDLGDRFGKAIFWMENNLAITILILTAFLIHPTWLLFRFSPRNTRHSIPKGIYIQVFMCSLIVIFILLSSLFDGFILLIPIYYYIAYRQLFGYSVWATLWRTVACLVGSFFIATITILLVQDLLSGVSIGKHSRASYIMAFIFLIAIVWGILYLLYLIGKFRARRRAARCS